MPEKPQRHPRLEVAAWRTASTSHRLFDALEADGRSARFVGGCVRDALAGLDRPAWDVDLCTPEPPERVLELLAAGRIRAIPTGLDHGTVTALVDDQRFEITTLRRDVATDGRRAVVAYTDSFRCDAARRDFTINAMSCDRSGQLFDYFSGLADLGAGVVRFVGDPATRIAEDRLRVLRYFRFHASFGHARPDPPTASALRAGAFELDQLSGERLQQETFKLLRTADPRAAVDLMAEFGVLQALFGAPVERALFRAYVDLDPTLDPVRRLAALVRPGPVDTRALARRLRFAKADEERLVRLVAVPAAAPERVDDAELRRQLYRHGPDVAMAGGLFALAQEGSTPAAASVWRARVDSRGVPSFPLAGRDVVDAGVAPGPDVGRYLHAVEDWWVEGGCVADRGATLARLYAVVAGVG